LLFSQLTAFFASAESSSCHKKQIKKVLQHFLLSSQTLKFVAPANQPLHQLWFARLPHITNAEARELTPAKWLAARQAEFLTA